MLPYSSSTPMMDARPYSGCPIPPATRLLTDKDMREYLMKVPTIYAEAVAEGPHRSKEVAWMQRVGLLQAAEKMREATARRQAAFEQAQHLH